MSNHYEKDPVALSWARGAISTHSYVNLGDALSPYLVTMVSGRRVAHLAFNSDRRRMGAIGTAAQSFEYGEVDIWGTGCSPWLNPLHKNLRRPYEIPDQTRFHVHATRGPMGAQLLGAKSPVPFGDPAVLLPRFYAPNVPKKYEIGVVLHLSELQDRSFTALPKPKLARYDIPAELSDDVRLITMVAPDTIDGVQGKLDEILSCKRIVSTSLHGVALAIAYGIPAFYLGSDKGPDGLAETDLLASEIDRVNARFIDLYGGYGETRMIYYRQRRTRQTDWPAIIKALDDHAPQLSLDNDALIEACPAGAAPISAALDGAIWQHPAMKSVPVAVKPPLKVSKAFGAFIRASAARFTNKAGN
jgi:hypothetical protein